VEQYVRYQETLHSYVKIGTKNVHFWNVCNSLLHSGYSIVFYKFQKTIKKLNILTMYNTRVSTISQKAHIKTDNITIFILSKFGFCTITVAQMRVFLPKNVFKLQKWLCTVFLNEKKTYDRRY